MNNDDYYNDAMNRGKYLEGARLAIEFGMRKSSRAGAVAWAKAAIAAAEKEGVNLEIGHLRWPDFDGMLAQIDKIISNC